jgi:flagellar motor component MotA
MIEELLNSISIEHLLAMMTLCRKELLEAINKKSDKSEIEFIDKQLELIQRAIVSKRAENNPG